MSPRSPLYVWVADGEEGGHEGEGAGEDQGSRCGAAELGEHPCNVNGSAGDDAGIN